MIRIHNSLSGHKETLTPITPGRVPHVYVCGITGVRLCARWPRPACSSCSTWCADICSVARFAVTLVQNITDIDDKIIRRAAENGESMEALVDRFIRAMHEDRERLGIVAPDYEPRATQISSEIIFMVRALDRAGYAYVAANGDVMYSVAKFEGYGRLSGKCLADLRVGARVAVVEAKRIRWISLLWKSAKPGEPLRGNRPGAEVGPAGTSSARPCRFVAAWRPFSIFMAVDSI